ncbi:MAG: RtcB family protein [Synergistaceae bacterium]|jgi:RNA-splicing ligase RtcB|nr:RtcB family protein [Synergistaceae bacterium]
MIEIKGAHNAAICYCKTLEEYAEQQIRAVCDKKEFENCKIRIMPDVHAGTGCVIGTTMTVEGRVVPGMVGVDIGCGMETARIGEKKIDFKKLDDLIRNEIPCGREIRETFHSLNDEIDLASLRCILGVKLERARRSIGTLGGGNHFIEVDRDEDGALYIVVHSGSRHIGNEVAKYYQDEGFDALHDKARFQLDELIARLKAEGRAKEIQRAVRERRANSVTPTAGPKDLAYVEGRLFDDYIHDMKIIQRFAVLNRRAMMDVIVEGMGLSPIECFTTVHNYIDTDEMILRKGAVSAKAGEKLLIPINMSDGSLVCIGKGNPDWNYSAPHGAGRLMSRAKAFETLSLDKYRGSMEGIFSTCVTRATLDESPMAYKGADEIISQIKPTAEIVHRLKPLYNFKSSE